MHKPEKRITDFIREHHVLTLSTSGNNTPWCAHCFYAYLEKENLLIFTSDEKTRHVKEVRKNPEIAGSIVLETKIVGKIQGIQFRGTMEKPKETLLKKTRSAYLKRFPYAILMHTSLWIIKLHYIKMTDNRLGFGKKRIWQLPG